MLTFLDRFPVQKMSQRIRTNGSPTSSCSGVTAGSPSGSPGISAVGVSLLGRLLPMKATVPFQLKAQAQHPLQTRTVLSTGNGTYSRSPTRSLSTITAPVSSPPASQCTPGTTSASPALPSPSRSSPANPRTSHAQYSGVHVSPQCCSDSSLLVSCSSASPPPPSSSSSSSSSTTTFSSLWSCGHRAKQLQLPEHDRLSPDRLSPSSPVCTDKLRLPVANSWCTTNCNGNIRRTSSLDALTAPYLSGHWPRDLSQAPCAPCMKDKSTQTPSAWADEYEEEKKRGCHKRSASCGSTDQLKEIVKLRQQLQRSKHSSRHHRDKDRKSPFNGNHSAINQSQAPVPKNVLISIPISKSSVSRFRNSVEGLNQEIERINIRDPGDREEFILHEAPDGHRAPLPLSSRSIDTQTPLGTTATSNHSNSSSRSHSISPTFLNVPSEPCSNSSSPHEDETLADGREKDLTPGSPLPKYASSPKPNNSYMFKREPPEGCERVKVFTEETQARPRRELPQFIPPDKNKVNFIPQIGSAFCPVSNHRSQMTTQELHNLKNQSLTPEASRRSCLLSPSPSSCLSEN